MERKISPFEQRLTVLYALNALGDVTGLQLLQFVAENDLMDYFSLQLTLYDLQNTGYIQQTHHPLGTLYSMTGEGAQALRLFLKRIPQSKRQLTDSAAPNWRKRFNKEKEVIATHHILPTGGQQLELMIRQGSEYLMLIILVLKSEMSVQPLIKAFENSAETIYASIFEKLSHGYVPGNRKVEDMATCAIPVAGQKYLIEFRSEHFSVMLPVPDWDMACHYADVWADSHQQIRHSLISMLSE